MFHTDTIFSLSIYTILSIVSLTRKSWSSLYNGFIEIRNILMICLMQYIPLCHNSHHDELIEIKIFDHNAFDLLMTIDFLNVILYAFRVRITISSDYLY